MVHGGNERWHCAICAIASRRTAKGLARRHLTKRVPALGSPCRMWCWAGTDGSRWYRRRTASTSFAPGPFQRVLLRPHAASYSAVGKRSERLLIWPTMGNCTMQRGFVQAGPKRYALDMLHAGAGKADIDVAVSYKMIHGTGGHLEAFTRNLQGEPSRRFARTCGLDYAYAHIDPADPPAAISSGGPSAWMSPALQSGIRKSVVNRSSARSTGWPTSPSPFAASRAPAWDAR